MFIYKLDYLSPKITLYFKGNYKHSSIYSVLITIISYLIIFVFIIYYLIDFLGRKNPTIYFFNRYVEDIGNFPLNSSAIFHYLTLIKAGRNANTTFDFNSINIYGVKTTLDSYIQDYELVENNHWVYDLCDDSYDISSKTFSQLIDKKTFSTSACIKKYYNSKEKKYFEIGDSGFIWPVLEHGASHPNRTLYGIIIEKCQNDSLRNNCNPIEKIDDYFRRIAITLNFLDHYSDVLNYKEPFITYIYTVASGLTSGAKTIGLNNLNFNPSITRTHNGILLENLIEEKRYTFLENERKTIEQGQKKTISAFYFYVQNNMIYNERHYKKCQELLSDIGGLGSFILLIGFFINSFFSYYIIILDTQDLIFNIEKLNTPKYDHLKKQRTLIKEKEKIFTIKKIKNNNNDIQNFSLQNSNYLLFKNENEKNTEFPKLFIKNNRERKNSCCLPVNNKVVAENKNFNFSQNCKSNSEVEKNQNNLQFFEIKNTNNIAIPKPVKKQQFNWCNYFLYILLFKSNNSKLKFYENFRAQILSEENIVQNNLDLYKLLKFCGIKKPNIFENDEMKID